MENNEIKEIEVGEKYLPIGTVVMLKGGSKRVMITGFCTIAQEQQDKVFDYSGCIYPEGFIDSNQVCLFDHEQIDKVYHLGLIDDEEKSFKERLAVALQDIGEENLTKMNLEQQNTSEVQPTVEPSPVPAVSEVPTMPAASEVPSMPAASEVPSMPATAPTSETQNSVSE